VTPLKIVIVTQWVKSPTRPKASQQVDSRTEVRSPKRRCAKQREGKGAGRVSELRKMYSCGQRISPGNRIQSRQCPVTGRQQSSSRQGKRAGPHRSLRAGHVFTGVIRELGRASRLLGSKSRSEGDRHNQHPGVYWPTRPTDEPTSAQAERDTKTSASTQGTGREPKANRPGRTKAVVATHRTAGQGATSAQTRGELRPKGPTIKAARQREGNAGHDVCARERQERP
jgi:hypothetical protein